MKTIEDVKIGDAIYEIDGKYFRERGKVIRICKPEDGWNVYRIFLDTTSSYNYITVNPGACISFNCFKTVVYVWDNIEELKIIHQFIIEHHLSQLADGLNSLFGGNLIKE